jgi:hypothetical protein
MSELYQKESYKQAIDNTFKDIIEIYTRIVVDYLHFMQKSKKIQQKVCFKFILYRGLETMTRVFNYILFFTRDLEIAKAYSEKSMFYYIEFVSQINKDQHAFLQFTSRDAVLYVYKKTIYDIRAAFSSDPTSETLETCKDVYLYTQLIQNEAASCDDLLDETTVKKFEKIYLSLKDCSTCFTFSDIMKTIR